MTSPGIDFSGSIWLPQGKARVRSNPFLSDIKLLHHAREFRLNAKFHDEEKEKIGFNKLKNKLSAG